MKEREVTVTFRVKVLISEDHPDHDLKGPELVWAAKQVVAGELASVAEAGYGIERGALSEIKVMDWR